MYKKQIEQFFFADTEVSGMYRIFQRFYWDSCNEVRSVVNELPPAPSFF